MTIHGLPSPSFDPRVPRAEDRAPATPDLDRGMTARSTVEASATARTVRPASAVPAEAPPGTDPALWNVLTTEERQFFSRAVTGGPLTYTRMMGALTQPAAAAMPRGGRMDVRV